MSSLNYMELCRLCLVKDRVQIPIFEGEGDIRQIFLKIAACLPVKVKKDDKLPKKICDDCMYKVEMLYQFWNTTANAEKQLLEWLGEAVEEKKTSNETHVKQESMEQDPGSELAKSLSRVEAVLAEAREAESDTDNFGVGKAETDSDDEPLSSLEPTTFVGVDSSGTNVSQTQGEFLAPSAPSTSKTSSALQSSGIVKVTTTFSTSPKNYVVVPVRRGRLKDSRRSSDNMASDSQKEITTELGLCGNARNEELSLSYLEPEIKIEAGSAANAARKDQLIAEKRSDNVRCTLCGEMVPASNIDKHKLVEEVYLKALKCMICKVTFDKKSTFRIHIYEQHKIHHCKECSEVFSKRQHYRTHKEIVHNTKNKPRVPCDLCTNSFANKQILKRHRNEVHYGQREPEAKCPQCDYKSYNRSNMKVHIDKHNKTPAFVCHLCGKGFYTKISLSDHATNAHGQGFRCDICNKRYRNECSLKSHIKIHEPNFDPATLKHQCEECGEIFNHKSSLNKHLLKHKGLDKTFDCNVCGKKVSSKGSYRSHMAIHSGYKPYSCEFCAKRFADKQYLTQHRRVHTGEKPFKCDLCGQCFNQRSSLTRHKRYHLSAGRR